MTREEQTDKAVENLLDEAEIDILDRPLLKMWYKLGVNFADKNPIDRTDWRQVRIQAAIAAMQGMCSNENIIISCGKILQRVLLAMPMHSLKN